MQAFKRAMVICVPIIMELKGARPQEHEGICDKISVDPMTWVMFSNTYEKLQNGTDAQVLWISNLFWDAAKIYFEKH